MPRRKIIHTASDGNGGTVTTVPLSAVLTICGILVSVSASLATMLLQRDGIAETVRQTMREEWKQRDENRADRDRIIQLQLMNLKGRTDANYQSIEKIRLTVDEIRSVRLP